VIQNVRLADGLDLLQTMCELLATRISFIAQEKKCPADLISTVASVREMSITLEGFD
jgi:hypothetical protein